MVRFSLYKRHRTKGVYYYVRFCNHEKKNYNVGWIYPSLIAPSTHNRAPFNSLKRDSWGCIHQTLFCSQYSHFWMGDYNGCSREGGEHCWQVHLLQSACRFQWLQHVKLHCEAESEEVVLKYISASGLISWALVILRVNNHSK